MTDNPEAHTPHRQGLYTVSSPTSATDSTPDSANGTEGTDASGGRTAAEDRGTLTIAEKVIEKIASQIAADTPGVHGSSGGFLGIGSRDDEDARPKVTAELHGRTASLQVRAGVRYPTPLRVTTERLRERIRTQVSKRCGVDVRQVDIDITSLVARTDRSGRRELQ
ncbi:Asp23/Gls24 family envelope stress response protein [Arthrobacter sp. TmT3-37]